MTNSFNTNKVKPTRIKFKNGYSLVSTFNPTENLYEVSLFDFEGYYCGELLNGFKGETIKGDIHLYKKEDLDNLTQFIESLHKNMYEEDVFKIIIDKYDEKGVKYE